MVTPLVPLIVNDGVLPEMVVLPVNTELPITAKSVAAEDDWNLASEAVKLIEERGFARGRQLTSELHILRNQER